MQRRRAISTTVAVTSGDVVKTRDGLVLEGKATRGADGSVTVETPEGAVRLDASRVASLEEGEGPRTALGRELASLGKDDVGGRYRLALRAEAAGAAEVVKAASDPFAVPSELAATARKWYGVLHLSPVTALPTATAPLPDPSASNGVVLP